MRTAVGAVSEFPADATPAVAVAEILDHGFVGDLAHFPELADIARIRAAARRVREADLDPDGEDHLMAGLARQAARAALPLWCLDALLAEIRGFEPDEIPMPLSVEQAARRIRMTGYSVCPTCRREVVHELTLERSRRARAVAEDAADRWRKVAPLAGE